MTCLPSISLTTMSCRNDSLSPLTGSLVSLGPSEVVLFPRIFVPESRSYSAMIFGFRGSVMSAMSMSVDSSLSTSTAYAFSGDGCQAKALWTVCALPPAAGTSPKPLAR